MTGEERAIFRSNLLVQRKASGLKGREIAKKLGVAQSTVSMWEHGKAAPVYLSRLKQLADVLGCTVDDLTKEKRKGVRV